MSEGHDLTQSESVAELFAKADWRAITALSDDQLSDDPSGALAFAFAANAHQQLGATESASNYVKRAHSLGCSIPAIIRILIAGVYQTLGRLLLLRGSLDAAKDYFDRAQKTAALRNAGGLSTHEIVVREQIFLGLLPDAANRISTETWRLKEVQSAKEIDDRVSMLRTELAVLNEELSHALRRNQLYRSKSNDGEKGQSLESKSMSQLGQDLWALKMCGNKQNGFFVEFGATDGIALSNSYLLEKEFNWQGILAEPNPKFLEELRKNRDTIVTDECISGKTGESVEFIFADVFGGMARHADEDKHGEHRRAFKDSGNTTTLTTISLDDFLKKYNAPKQIDYISVDTEGSEFEILKEFPFDQWDVRCWTVEHNYAPIREKLYDLFSAHGYTRVEAQWDDWYYR